MFVVLVLHFYLYFCCIYILLNTTNGQSTKKCNLESKSIKVASAPETRMITGFMARPKDFESLTCRLGGQNYQLSVVTHNYLQ